MEPETINSTELRTKTRDLMERVKFKHETFIIETFGRPMAVIINFEEFARLQDLLKAAAIKPPPTKVSRKSAKQNGVNRQKVTP